MTLWICQECPDEVGCVKFAQLPPKECICGPHIGVPMFRRLDVDDEDLKEEMKDRGFNPISKKTLSEALLKYIEAIDALNRAVGGQ